MRVEQTGDVERLEGLVDLPAGKTDKSVDLKEPEWPCRECQKSLFGHVRFCPYCGCKEPKAAEAPALTMDVGAHGTTPSAIQHSQSERDRSTAEEAPAELLPVDPIVRGEPDFETEAGVSSTKPAGLPTTTLREEGTLTSTAVPKPALKKAWSFAIAAVGMLGVVGVFLLSGTKQEPRDPNGSRESKLEGYKPLPPPSELPAPLPSPPTPHEGQRGLDKRQEPPLEPAPTSSLSRSSEGQSKPGKLVPSLKEPAPSETPPHIRTIDILVQADQWSQPILLPPEVRFSIKIDGRVRIRNGDQLYFADPNLTLSMGDGLSRRFEFKSAEHHPVKVSISYETPK